MDDLKLYDFEKRNKNKNNRNIYSGSIVKLMIATILYIVQGCQYTDYEESLLSKKNQIEKTIIYSQGSTQSFAFWSFCIPAWEVDGYPQVEEMMFEDNRNQQLLFLINSGQNDQSLIMFMYVDFISGKNEVIHSLHINTQLQEKVYEYKFDSKIYEGKWYLSMITIGSQFIKFQTSESNNYYDIQDEIPIFNTFQIIIGGTGIVSHKYYLGIFRGRLSKLITIEDEVNQNLIWVLSNCYVPININGGQTIYLINDVQIFKGNTQLIKEIDQVGKSFRFFCWVKYDFSEASFTTTYLLLRLTIFKNYGDELRLGDELAKITVDLDNSQPQNCGYDVISHMYSTPNFGPINEQYQQRLNFRDYGGYFYQQLQQWHIVSFFYRQTDGPSVTFNFISSNNIIHEKFPEEYAQGLFTNTKYYAIIGSDRTIQQKLRGQIANAKFENIYSGSIVKLMIATILYIVQGCQYTDYEESLLSKKNQIEKTIIYSQGSTQSFAFWSFCIPAWEVDGYPQVEEMMFEDNRNQQLLFLINSGQNDQSLIMFMYVDFISGKNEVIHSLHINTQLQEKVYEYKFDSKIYEGKWYLSMITIGSQFIKFQTSESNNYYDIQDEIPIFNTFQIIIGGTGIVSHKYYLGIFRGRLSKLITIEDEVNQNLIWVLSNCYVPININGGQTIYLINDVQIFKGNTQLIKEIDQVGKSFRFFCWVKYDFSEASFTTTYLLLRLTIFKNYGDELRLGDELAKITVDLDNSQPQNCGYDVISHMYSTPNFGPINEQYQQRLNFRDYGGYFYQQLQQWHIVSFFYRQTDGPSVTFNFISSNNIIHEKFPEEYAQGLFTNTKYYAIIGSDRTIQQKLRGQIANAKFEYNYEENTELNIGCHQTCSKCNGPLSTNCLECDSNKNRIFSEDLKICSCKYNFIEQQDECKSYTQIYSNIQILDVFLDQNNLICEYGYFYLPTIKECIKCPQENKVTILCADCLIYPNTWYQKPVCTIDYIVDSDSEKPAYRLEQRSTFNYDVYLIDQDANLVLINGVENYCNGENDLPNFFNIEKQTHLFETFYIMCKQDHYFENNKCLKSVQHCIKSHYWFQICQQCENGYYLYNNIYGYEINNKQGCTKCGHNCQICKFQQMQNSDIQLLRCLKCVHDQKYYISLDGENCFENQIQNCLYAFEVSRNDNKINSLEYEFNTIQSGSLSICGQCQEKYTYNIDTNQCESQQSAECYYSYSYITPQALIKEVCLFGPKINTIVDPISFITESPCLNYNCHICMIRQINIKVSYICLECNNGYYAEKLSGYCLPCPQELKCQVCYQQHKISKDNWKNQIRAFYRSIIDDDLQSHSFIEYGLSQDIGDYEIVCQFCIDGYQLHNGKCIPVCPSSCLKCKIINDENICIQCPQIQGKRSLSVQNNQCIQCPAFCVICRIREQEEIKLINPVFNNLDFYYYSNQCLQKQLGYYDKDLKMYVDCPQGACMKELYLSLLLYCQKEEYDKEIQFLKSEEDVKSFKQKNILIDDLFSNSSFPQFEQPEFYQMANEQVVKSIIITIHSLKPQNCIITNNNKSIKQKFSQNIFSAINVQLELYGNENTIFQYDKTIQIVNFKKVIFNGIILQPSIYFGFKQLFFNSIFEQTIQLINTRYISDFKYQFQSQILIWNSTDVLISTFTIQDLILSDVQAFILVENINSIQKIIIENMNVINCKFNMLNVFQFNTKSTDQLIFYQSNFNSIWFYASKLIYSTSGSLLIQDTVIQQCVIKDVLNLIGGNLLMQIQIKQVLIQTNKIVYSKIFGMGYKFVTIFFHFIKNEILDYSSLISNYNSQVETVDITQIEFSLNVYDKSSNFISIRNDLYTYKQIKFNSLTLHVNVLNSKFNQISPFNPKEFLIFLDVQDLEINNLVITKGFGITDIVVQKGRFLKLRQVQILQDKSYQIQGLHQYADCVESEAETKYSFTSLYLYNIESIEIQELLIESVTMINNPIIHILQPESYFNIIISELYFKNNLVLILNSQDQASILQITSQSYSFITIQNSVMENNLMHQYRQNDQINSALLFNFDCSECTTNLENLTIQANLVTNSTQGILFLKSNKIIMKNAVFRFNCISNFSILQPHILWGFTNDQKIFLENIIDIFPIKVSTGIVKLEGKEIEINNVSISNSTGTGFYISLLNEASCVISDIVFTSLKSLFLEKNENGGAIVLDTTQIFNATIKIQTIRLSNIQCRQKGGFIYLINGQGESQIFISNVILQDVYALQGSIIYSEISAQSNTSKLINLQNFHIKNTQNNQLSFLSQFNNLDDLDEFQQLSYQRYLICIYNAQTIVISNFSIFNLKYESFLYVTNTFQIQIKKIVISQSIFLNAVIQIDSKKRNTTIFMSDLHISNISIFAVIPDKFECLIQQINPMPYQTFSCLNQYLNRISPKNLTQFYENQQDKKAGCVINKMKIQNRNENLSVIDIIPFKSNMTILQVQFQDIDCENCQNGLFNIPIKESQSILDIKYINIYRNKCGKSSCINIYNNIQSRRRLQKLIPYVNNKTYQVNVLNYICQQNQGYEGTCLRVQNITTLILSSTFKNNIAVHKGGAILVIGIQDFFIERSIIIENIANIGGGIFMTDQMIQNMTLLDSYSIDNNAKKYGNDAAQVPSQLAVSIDTVNYLQKRKILQTENLVIEQVQIKEYEVMKNVLSNTIYFPNGQTISQYKYFDWQKEEYQPYKLHLRIVAQDQYDSIIKNLEKTQCTIKGRLLDDEIEREFTTNFTNLEHIEFDNQDYNLDKMIIYLDDELNMTLQLQFNCSSIYIPVIGKQQQIQSYHQNYYLRMNVKSLPCQLGEIKKIQTKICVPCDPDQGQYSLVINAQKCQIKDDVSTIEIKSAQLNLREGYWRPYINTYSISQCINLLQNCNGGWSQGDNSCTVGHIGALCEECDLYDSRGYGQFSTSVKYSCASCVNNFTNIIIITLITIKTLISILISVKSTLALLEQIATQIQMTKLKFIKKQKYSQSAILIKMLTNHLQILTAITTFKIDFSFVLTNSINSKGNPIQTMTYSLDCFLIQMFSVEIHYARIIWQLIMPFIYIIFFLGIYNIIVKFCSTEYSLSVITTTFIYIYIQNQPNLIGGFISLISFRSISGYQWIQANVAYRYDTPQHFIWLAVFCLPGLFLFAFLIPSLFFISLYINRNILNEKRIRQKLGYLYNEYKTSAYFWEIVKIVEKELVIIFLSYYDDDIIQKGTLVLLVVYLYSELNYRFRPYKMSTLNNLDAHSAKVCQVSIILGCGIYINQLYGNIETQIPYFLILVVLNFFYLLMLLNQILKSYWEDLDDQLDKLREKIIAIAPWTMDYPCLRIYLESSIKRRKRVQGQYQKIKKYLLSYAKPIKELKDNLNSIQNEIRPSINMSITINQIRIFKEIQKQI
ncbi:unnamed protein product [Paramecium pentaurelia]|uniref:Uncharacterized protein n=2 Tax=Paramecium pentaurelia TaxID=43138 RepID=A0A8S1XMB7_9CILI|nr:unnamed protein product [Paramecium pentaurelia]